MKKTPKIMRGLPAMLLTTLLASGSPAFAGNMAIQIETDKTIVPLKVEAKNPLSFYDGALVFDVQERLRFEVRENNFDFNNDINTINDDSWLLQRFRIGVAIKPTSWLKIYVQGQDSQEEYSERPDIPGVLGAEGDDSFDLRQAYLEIGNPKGFTLTIGRQVLSYGDERLVGAFDWNNIGRTFDAVKARYVTEKWTLDAFVSSVVVPTRGTFNYSDVFDGNETDRGQIFSGIYFSSKELGFQTTDLYLFQLHEQTPRVSRVPNKDTDFVTMGFRIKSTPEKLMGFDYEAEGAVQTGEVKGVDLDAYAIHLGVGYTLPCSWKPRFGIEFNLGSGDEDPTDDHSETFQNLFPTNHKFYGYMDAFSWQNMREVAAQFKVQPCKTVAFQVDYHAFWLDSTDDVWYRANGVTAVRPLTPAARNADNYTGSEADVTLTWQVKKWAHVQIGYSHFFAGDYLNDTGAGEDADFAYLQTTFNF